MSATSKVVLGEEGVKRLEQIFFHIKAIMRHERLCNEGAWTKAALLKGVSMLYRYQQVFLSVDDEGWASHSMYFAKVVELLGKEE